MHYLQQVTTVLSRVSACAVATLTLLVVTSAVLRYLVGTPLRFSDELVSLLYLVSAFLTLPRGASASTAIRVEIVASRLRGRLAIVIEALACLVLLVFALWFGLLAYEFTAFNLEIDARTEQAELPLGLWTAVMPIGMAVVAMVGAANLLRAVLALAGRVPTTPRL